MRKSYLDKGTEKGGLVSLAEETRWVDVKVVTQNGVCGEVIKIVFPYFDFLPSSKHTKGVTLLHSDPNGSTVMWLGLANEM